MKKGKTMSPEQSADKVPVIQAAPSKKSKLDKIKMRKRGSGTSPMVVFVALFAIFGVYFVVNSFAATSSLAKTWATLSDWSAGTLSNVSIVNNAVALSTVTNSTSSAPTTTTTSTTNLALNKPVMASSTNTDGSGVALPASNATDGNTATRWGSQYSDPQWIYVDLGASYSISEVKLNWETAYGKAYEIQVSGDATNWTTIYSTTTGAGGVNDLTGLNGAGRYVRMYGTVRGTSWGYSLYEFQVYGLTTVSSNIALKKPINASSVGTVTTTTGHGKKNQTQTVSQPASNANDGNTSTRWLSASGDTQWIYADLGSSTNLSEVKLNWGSNYATTYEVQVSNDASSWNSIYATSAGDGGIDDLSGISGTGRYVRLYATARSSTSSGYSLNELEVYGASTVTTTSYTSSGNIVLSVDGDAGTASTSPVSWTSIAPTTSVPSGTAISFEARTSGNNTDWSAWTAVSGSLSGLSSSRYLQIRANLSTSNAAVTPLLQKLVLNYVVTTPDPTPAPTVSLSASPTSIAAGAASTLTWSSTNATSCTASGAWTGAKSTSGTASTGALSASASYTLSCSGGGGTASASTAVTVTAPPAGTAPSGVNMPVGDVTSGGHTWHQILKEDFTKDLALGTWNDSGTTTACPSNADAVQYTGNEGTKWSSYPKCYLNTDRVHHYRSDQTLSVHDGQLDFWLHSVGGIPTSASPGPIMPDGTRYQTYGRYEVRFKTTTHTFNEFYVAWLLWTKDDTKWTCSESDFPESNLGQTTVNAFAHYNTDNVNCPDANRSQDAFSKAVDFTGWHTYTQEWMPGRRNYYLDGVLMGSSTNYVYANPERWQLQTEVTSSCDAGTTNTCTQDGHLLVDWATVYSY